ncbi:MAG: VWA domain-containing protein [Elusimicrobia bacterium]|jgi:hypothetical protein|nr:VWA domain-containing protein [Elusimicrobiota bacterium]MBK7544487.1 VWA domain-containing protein [Elusimicrobiota bacterium]MBK7574010.1 VWA domain-containing protein [Elusimicrobiota bacterium]MBK7689041.1 VWA domain-containing protein [Elusimicrobiota bacterium]MBK8126150.1 VWA domain-containing protein [Elusimicrobiota bacterium]
MKRISAVILSFFVVSAGAHPVDPRPDRPLVQLALLLDTSNSMDGLIDQAKSQLWRIVNDLAGSRCRGHAPRIEVALYEYGNSGLSAGEKYLRQVLPFTRDLDRVSEMLFGLRTNGGEEYCGAVIKDAVKNLQWDGRASTYKTLFIAGNEPFTQGDVNFRDAVQKAVDRGVVVNTIFCGDRREGLETGWRDGADRGRGAFLTINQDRDIVVRRSPYDDEIERLGRLFNDTFVYFGARAEETAARQSRADAAALKAAPAGASVERSLFKSKRQYSESLAAEDAVSAVVSGRMKAVELEAKDLPAEMRGKDAKELEGALKAKQAEREKIQSELDALGKKREKFLAEKPADAKDTLDRAILDAVREQARGLGYAFDSK